MLKNKFYLSKLSKLLLVLASILIASSLVYIGITNASNNYTFTSLTESDFEASRTHRMKLVDFQPTGIYTRKGEVLNINVKNINKDYVLSVIIGFQPMWSNTNTFTENNLVSGKNKIIAKQDGIIFIKYIKKESYDNKPQKITLRITGGIKIPLYILGKTNIKTWNKQVSNNKSPYVQLMSDKVLITIPAIDYRKNPIKNIDETFKMIYKVINLQDELSGFDNGSYENTKTKLRLHYIVDEYASPKDKESFYMYASDYTIGMKSDNFTDLTDPIKLNKEWSIWHETGHTYQ
jgi:Peptidase M60, enhancin and enhancin-like/N-terminal domain of M60-like peptidases